MLEGWNVGVLESWRVGMLGLGKRCAKAGNGTAGLPDRREVCPAEYKKGVLPGLHAGQTEGCYIPFAPKLLLLALTSTNLTFPAKSGFLMQSVAKCCRCKTAD